MNRNRLIGFAALGLSAVGVLCNLSGCERPSVRGIGRGDDHVSFDIPFPELDVPAPRASQKPGLPAAIGVAAPEPAAPTPTPLSVVEPEPNVDVAANIDVTIAAPRDGEPIPAEVYDGLHGTFTGDLPRDHELFVLAQDVGSFYLMLPPATVSRKTREFFQPSVRLTSLGPLRLHVCLANADTTRWLHEQAGVEPYRLASLPAGLEIMATTKVNRIVVEPLLIDTAWVPSGWMGDGETEGALRHATEFDGGPDGRSYDRWTYDPSQGYERWVAVSYQFGNFGEDKPGKDLRGKGFRRISWSVRGTPKAEVRFLSGGHTAAGAKYPASYESGSKTVTLEEGWRRYSLSLDGCDLSNVVAALVFVIEHPRDAVSFDLTNVRFEGAEE